MKAVVLVGGEGTRLRPLTFTTPKSLLPIANQPFLERQLAWLESHGVDEVVLSLGYLPDAFTVHFPEGRCGGIRLTYAVEPKPLGTAGGIRFAADGIDDVFIVCNGDILTDFDLSAMLRFHETSAAQATIALTQVDDPSAFGVVPTRDDGEVVGFIEKPPRDLAPTNWINAGIYILEPGLMERIPKRVNVSIERETFPRMVETRNCLYAWNGAGYWLDMGTPAKYLQAHADLLAGTVGALPAPGAVEGPAGVWTQGIADVDPEARLTGPVLVGPGARIEAGASVTASAVGAGAVVGAGARVERSVVFAGAQVSERAIVTDSVLGADAILKPEVVLTDVTLIGAGVHIAAGTRISGGRVPPAE
ncbi:MAG TPA: NDP-sugar synthase [Acidimicrobiia bacterium]|jgi:NDP-sugar pyrophosphorylase family protein|nr:NDP-sugar synthase [Acidimicrobiia bacterium]